MKALIPLACLAVGITIGWFANPVTPAKPAPATSADASSSHAIAPDHASTKSHASVTVIHANTGKSEAHSIPEPSPADKEAGKKQMELMAKRMTDMQRKKFEARLDKMAAALDLTAEQKEIIRATMEKRFEKMGSLFNPDPTGNPIDTMELMKSDGVDDATAAVLSDAQKEQFTAFKGKERQGRIEARTLQNLGNVSSAIELTPDQKDAVYQVLSEQAAVREEAPKDHDYSSMFTEGMGIQVDDELGFGGPTGLITSQAEAAGAAAVAGQPATSQTERMRAALKQRTDSMVEALRPHLTAPQLEQYRAHLETKAAGMLAMFGGHDDEDE